MKFFYDLLRAGRTREEQEDYEVKLIKSRFRGVNKFYLGTSYIHD